ncbi:MAG: cation-translocating P-type ATPase [Isosphaeraceae bacterium]|nr:cation-translocating P-type ATPase [Isosphaeraceae bacterium]
MSQTLCTLKVQGLDCPTEVAALQAALNGTKGVLELTFDLIHGTMTVRFDDMLTRPEELVERVAARAGMQAELAGRPAPAHTWWGRYSSWVLVAGSGLALAAGVAIEHLAGLRGAARGAYFLSIAAGGWLLFPKALRAARQGRFDIHLLMGLAILGALALSQWDEAATVAFLFGLSELLESLSLERARRAVRALLDVAPQTAEVKGPDGAIRVVPAGSVHARARVQVRAGETVPVDGTILLGRSSVDQKAITGESVPIPREPGDPVFAGTVNGEGTLEIEANGPVDDSLVARIVARVREAQAGRAPMERRIERFARIYTPLVILTALLVMIVPPLIALAIGASASWGLWFGRGLIVLVIACPCALVIATPVAVVSALAAAARRGILIKGGQYLEEFGRLQALAFDKTGTLTKGEPDVVEIVPAGEQGDTDVLRIAAALGNRGGHVLGRAIARHALGMNLDVPDAHDYTAFPGLGAQAKVGAVEYHLGSHRYIDEAGLCQPDFHQRLDHAERAVGTSVALSAPSGPLGWIRLADRARPEASRVLAELHDLGVKTVMLTGDNPQTASAMARELGITRQRAGLLPADKATAIAELDAEHGPTGMVGDGVNDAPALAAARVSVALGGISSGAALETADIVLMADDLTGLPWLVRHSRRTLARIRQNIGIALATKVIVLILAVLGYAGMWLAIVSDVGASLVVTANALRLLRAPRE